VAEVVAGKKSGQVELDVRLPKTRWGWSGRRSVKIEVTVPADTRTDIRTGDGSVRLRIPDDLAADLDVHTGDGSIRSDLTVTVSGTVGRSTLRGKLNGGGATFLVRTHDGSIHLEKL